MARIVQRLGIIIAISASFIGYLFYTPHGEGIAQLDRIRTMSAAMRLTHLIVCYVFFVPFDYTYRYPREQPSNYLVCQTVF